MTRVPRGSACCACICDHDHHVDLIASNLPDDWCPECRYCYCREHGRQARRDALAELERAPAQPWRFNQST